MTTRVIIPWSEHVTSLTTSVSTVGYLIELMFILKVIKSHFKGSYDKQNLTLVVISYVRVGRKNPQKLTQVQDLIQDTSWEKRTAQKDITIDITSDSQVNSNFPNRWSPASLTFNNYFYLFLYLYIT